MAKHVHNCVLLIILSLLSIGSAQQGLPLRRQAEQEIFQRIFRPDSYKNDLNPGSSDTDGRTNVTVSLNVRDVSKIDDNNQEMVVHLILRQQWMDPRLGYSDRRIGPDGDPTTFLVLTDLSRLWRPDLFISNDIQSRRHDFSSVNTYARIYPDGTVFTSERLTVTTRCLLDFHQFPFDSQTCSMQMASYGYTDRDVAFQWKEVDPVERQTELSLTGYRLRRFETGRCDSQTDAGTYSCIKVSFVFNRLPNYYLVQVFIPLIMITLVSFTAFWVDPENLLTRVLTHLLSLFVMTVLTCRFNEQWPKVPYNKAVDIYTGLCLTFVFFTLLETMTVNYMRQKQSKEGKTKRDEPEAEALDAGPDGAAGGEVGAETAAKTGTKTGFSAVKFRVEKLLSKAGASKKMDVIARVVFPLTFLFFLVTYFAVYYSS